jgi:hypothetical protein
LSSEIGLIALFSKMTFGFLRSGPKVQKSVKRIQFSIPFTARLETNCQRTADGRERTPGMCAS